MFGGKVPDITHKSLEMIRGVKETSKAYGLSQKRSFDKVESSNKAGQENKFKRLDSGSKQPDNKPGSCFDRVSGRKENRRLPYGLKPKKPKQVYKNSAFQL